jgi:hypothetical protein
MMLGSSAAASVVVKQRVLRGHAHLGEHDPAHAVQLRQRHHAAHHEGEHVPQAALQRLGLHRFEHFVLADHAVRLDGVVQLGFVKLRAGDVGQHHAVAPRKRQLALVAASGLHQLRVALQRVDHLVRVLPRLLQRVGQGLGAGFGVDVPGLRVGLDEGGAASPSPPGSGCPGAGASPQSQDAGAAGPRPRRTRAGSHRRASAPAVPPRASRRWSCAKRNSPMPVSMWPSPVSLVVIPWAASCQET